MTVKYMQYLSVSGFLDYYIWISESINQYDMQINQIDNHHHLKYWTGHVVVTHAHRSFLTVVRHLNAICPPRVLYNTRTLTITLTISVVCWEICSLIGTPTDLWLMMLSSMMSFSKFHLDYMFCWLEVLLTGRFVDWTLCWLVITSFWQNPCENSVEFVCFLVRTSF